MYICICIQFLSSVAMPLPHCAAVHSERKSSVRCLFSYPALKGLKGCIRCIHICMYTTMAKCVNKQVVRNTVSPKTFRLVRLS